MKDNSIQIEAEAKALALQYGAMPLSEIIKWSDGVIQSEEKPDFSFIELSSSRSLGEALSVLNTFGQSGSKKEVSKIVFKYFYNALITGQGNFRRISKALFDMIMEEYSPSSDADGPMWSFWDDLDLATEGTYGDSEMIKKEMLDFLNKYKG